jgi:cystathionine gamma-synthase
MTSQPAPQNPSGWSTRSIHAGEARQKPGDAVTDAIYCTSTYTFASLEDARRFYVDKQPREEYGRYGNPSEKVLERKLAALEGGEDAVLYGSGMSALAGVLLATVKAGDEVVLVDQCYHRTRELCTGFLASYGVTTRLAPVCDYEALEKAVGPRTKLVVTECPTNPHLSIVDLKRVVAIARRHGAATLVDATLASPLNLRPLEHGADYVSHSCTKYLAGHNDLLAGAVIGSAEKLEPLRKLRGLLGMINEPHNVYLFLRGLKTFELRMQRHNENGRRLAEFLASHRRVEHVFYPSLPNHPQHELAARTMSGFGGIVTFLVKDADAEATAAVVDRVRIPRIGPSLGGPESLIDFPLLMSYHDFSADERRAWGIPDNMIRVACGLENPEDLIADFDQALRR